MSRTTLTRTALDAVSILGFGAPSTESPPQPQRGETIVRYGGWSLQELRDRCYKLMFQQDWYDKYLWSQEKLPSGLYVLRMPVPDSIRETFPDQQALLLPGEEVAPVVLAATALLAIRLSGGEDPLKTDWARCKEQTADGLRVELLWFGGRLLVGGEWIDDPVGVVWLASARRIS